MVMLCCYAFIAQHISKCCYKVNQAGHQVDVEVCNGVLTLRAIGLSVLAG